jgi:hypothetical protein
MRFWALLLQAKSIRMPARDRARPNANAGRPSLIAVRTSKKHHCPQELQHALPAHAHALMKQAGALSLARYFG